MPACTCHPCAADALPSGFRLALTAAVALVTSPDGRHRSKVTLAVDERPALLRLLGRLPPDDLKLILYVLAHDEMDDLIETADAQTNGGGIFASIIRALDQDDPVIKFYLHTLKERGGQLYGHARSVPQWSFCDLRFVPVAVLQKTLASLTDVDWSRLLRGADGVLEAHLLVTLGNNAADRLAACPPLSDPGEEEYFQRRAYDRALHLVVAAWERGAIPESLPIQLGKHDSFRFFYTDMNQSSEAEFSVCPFASPAGCALTDIWGSLFTEGGVGDVPPVSFADILLVRRALTGHLLVRLTPAAREAAVLSILAVLDPQRQAADPELADLTTRLISSRALDADWRRWSSKVEIPAGGQKPDRVSYFLPLDLMAGNTPKPDDEETEAAVESIDRPMEDILADIQSLVYPSGKPPPLIKEEGAADLARSINLRLASAIAVLPAEARTELLAGIRRRAPWSLRYLRADCWGGFADLKSLSDKALCGLAIRSDCDFLGRALADGADVLWLRLSGLMHPMQVERVLPIIQKYRHHPETRLAQSQFAAFARELIFEGHIPGWRFAPIKRPRFKIIRRSMATIIQ